MKHKQVYTIGKMGGLLPREYIGWRNEITTMLFDGLDLDRIDLTVINPNEFFGFEEKLHDNMMEIIKWELNAVKNSDVVIANLDYSNSTGSNIEIYTAWLNNIPIISYQPYGVKQHPWIEEFVTRNFTDYDNLVDYVLKYHINI